MHLGTVPAKLVRVIWKVLTDSKFNLSKVCIPISIDFEKHLKGALLKLPFFTTDMKKKFFANLWLTFHSWSPAVIRSNQQHYKK